MNDVSHRPATTIVGIVALWSAVVTMLAQPMLALNIRDPDIQH